MSAPCTPQKRRTESLGKRYVIRRVFEEVKARFNPTAKLVIAVAPLVAFLYGALALAAITGDSQAAPTAPTGKPAHPVVTKCHTVTPQTYNKHVRRLERIQRLNGISNKHLHRASQRVCKHGAFKRVVATTKKLCRPRHVVTGRVSWFSDGVTASGASASSTPGLALNISPGTYSGWNNPTVRHWMATRAIMRFKLNGRTAYTRIIDLGPHESTGRAIDASGPLVDQMGFSRGAFPTDSIGRIDRILFGCR